MLPLGRLWTSPSTMLLMLLPVYVSVLVAVMCVVFSLKPRTVELPPVSSRC